MAPGHLFGLQHVEAGQDFGRAHVEADPLAVLHRCRGVVKQAELGDQSLGGMEAFGKSQDVAPLQSRLLHTLEVDGRPLARLGLFHRAAVDLDAPYPGRELSGIDLKGVAVGDAPSRAGPGDHGAEALHGEDPVDGKAERP